MNGMQKERIIDYTNDHHADADYIDLDCPCGEPYDDEGYCTWPGCTEIRTAY